MIYREFQALVFAEIVFNSSFIRPTFFWLEGIRCCFFTIIRINRRHLETTTNIYIPGSIVIEFIQSLELRIKNILIRNRVFDDFRTQPQCSAKLRRELIGIRHIKAVIQTVCMIRCLHKPFIIFTFESVTRNQRIISKFPSFLYISNIAGQFSRRVNRTLFGMIIAVHFTIIIANNRFDSIIFPCICQSSRHAFIVISIIVLRIYRFFLATYIIRIRKAASCDISFLIH